MAGRLPFNLPNSNGQNTLQEAQIRAALGLSVGQIDEALYLQQQRELQRDFQLRQLLLQDQLAGQSRLDSLVAEQRLKQVQDMLKDYPLELQQHYAQNLLRAHGAQDATLLARAQLQQHLAQSQVRAQPNTVNSPMKHDNQEMPAQHDAQQQSLLNELAASPFTGNAIRRTNLDKRGFGQAETPAPKKRARHKAGGEEGVEKVKKSRSKSSSKTSTTSTALDQLGIAAHESQKDPSAGTKVDDVPMTQSLQALLDFASSNSSKAETINEKRGSFTDLLQAADSEEKSTGAANALQVLKQQVAVEWPESENDNEDEDAQWVKEAEKKRAVDRGDVIRLPNFNSILPQLPEEPFLVPVATPNKKRRKKQKSLLDVGSSDPKLGNKDIEGSIKVDNPSAEMATNESNEIVEPAVDQWWPTVASIRRERKASGEVEDDVQVVTTDKSRKLSLPFQADLSKIKERLNHEVMPAVLETLPHCRIHRMATGKNKVSPAEEFVHCFQVTELYPNELMVCCSHCGTWRHTSCGGHFKPYSVRECVEVPFAAVCDRCHAEDPIVRDFPLARKRIDRQRSEHLRRSLATSAAMRHATFAKHGGTYKWPLGSVSITHIGGHTRSVHTRQEKAEKQWKDMAKRLSSNELTRPKEVVKSRTRELEKLIAYVEEAEGYTDRHNMMLFLLQDTHKEVPVGFNNTRLNILDPAEDENSDDEDIFGDKDDYQALMAEKTQNRPRDSSKEGACIIRCARKECSKAARFDSVFCSDACGILSLEKDILWAFHYTSGMHPSLLRI